MRRATKARVILILFVFASAHFPIFDPFSKCCEKETRMLAFLKNPFIIGPIAAILAVGFKPKEFRMVTYALFLCAIIINAYFHLPIVQGVVAPDEEDDLLEAWLAFVIYGGGTFLYTYIHTYISYKLYALTEYTQCNQH